MANLLSRVRNALVPNIRAPVGPVNYPVDISSGGWWPIIREPFAGAWQRNLEVRADSVIANVTVFRCVSLISSDIAKMRMKLVQKQAGDNVWVETSNPAWSPVINNPNHFQNRIQFFENWMNSKLNHGNTYVLKERDNRNVVIGFYILDPRRTKPMVADNGDVYYGLSSDNLSGLPANVIVPASEIIHDRWNCMFHPLCGLSPIVANGIVATQGNEIAQHSARFFKNGANPGGILTAPGRINDTTAERLKHDWQERFTGENRGFVAVLGNGLKYEAMTMTSTDAQLIEQLRWTSETIAASYGVPGYKVGVATEPAVNNIEVLERQYYQTCLQIHIEAIELLIDVGLNLPSNWGVEFDLDGLLRMDGQTMMTYLSNGVKSALIEPNEGRGRLGLPPKPGGDALYLQQQNYSLEALAKRDASANPFAAGGAGIGGSSGSSSDGGDGGDGGDGNTAPVVDTPPPDNSGGAPNVNSAVRNILIERLDLASR